MIPAGVHATHETQAGAVFGSDRAGGTAELRAMLDGNWTRTLDSLKACFDAENTFKDDESD